MLYESDRTFRLWDYTVSHGQLLLRSPKSSNCPSNIDLAFFGVIHVDLTTTLIGLAVQPPSAEELMRAATLMGKRRNHAQVYCLESAGARFLVVAAGLAILENDLDIFESSLEYFAGSDPQQDRGVVLARS